MAIHEGKVWHGFNQYPGLPTVVLSYLLWTMICTFMMSRNFNRIYLLYWVDLNDKFRFLAFQFKSSWPTLAS